MISRDLFLAESILDTESFSKQKKKLKFFLQFEKQLKFFFTIWKNNWNFFLQFEKQLKFFFTIWKKIEFFYNLKNNWNFFLQFEEKQGSELSFFSKVMFFVLKTGMAEVYDVFTQWNQKKNIHREHYFQLGSFCWIFFVKKFFW